MLNRRLGVLRGDRAKLDELVQGLSVAAERAEAGIAALKAAAEDVGRGLERKIEQGRGLRDDLTYMIERGGGIADRLEGTIRARRERTDTRAKASASATPSSIWCRGRPCRPSPRSRRDGAAAPSRAERELLRALSGR